jgi:anti-sigma B factor antagonist
MHLRGRVRHTPVATVVELDGEADLAAAPQLTQLLNRGVAEAERRVVVDLDGLTLLDDTALGLLIGAAASARRHGRTMELLSTNARVRRRLVDTRVDRIVDIVDAVPVS